MPTHATNQIAVIVGRNLRTARDSRGWTQKDVGDRIGVTTRDISRWENGKVEPGPKYRHLLADVLFAGRVSEMYAEPIKEAA